MNYCDGHGWQCCFNDEEDLDEKSLPAASNWLCQTLASRCADQDQPRPPVGSSPSSSAPQQKNFLVAAFGSMHSPGLDR
ncbi:hypothetical protein PV327_010529 [Microctonus hyperodae]|uniref:Uncharacterized protein n=1 Tax=Microctonus hyperodae TaxID=165561 RepID=A0AA39FSR7_MICHY|nr:hypothetical protein PV327_010529 [Microctonus hyperodae]